MQPLARRERLLVGLWIVVGLVVWNGVYDFVMMRGVQTFLFHNALHQLGRGPDLSMKDFMDAVVFDAVWISTLWAGVIMLAGLMTIRVLSVRRARRT